jgi:uncharacterized protein YbaP (TraB family)
MTWKAVMKKALSTICLALAICSLNLQANAAPGAPAKKVAPAAAKSKTASKPQSTALPKPVKGDKLFMWKMTSDAGATVYFLGTIHLARSDFYPLADEIEKAFQKSSALLVESDISEKHETTTHSAVMQEKEFYSKQDNLANHVSPATLRALQKYCAATDIPETGFMRMKPWFVYIAVEQLENRRMGFLHKNGIDLHFINQANKSDKKVISLEKDHDDVLAGMDTEMQDSVLRLSLIDIDLSTPDSLLRLMKIWKTGDEKGMADFVNRGVKKEPELASFNDRLLYDRNKKMADTIEPYLKGQGTFMVAVGSAHLVGDKNIIELLKQRGYKVNQVLVGDEI